MDVSPEVAPITVIFLFFCLNNTETYYQAFVAGNL